MSLKSVIFGTSKRGVRIALSSNEIPFASLATTPYVGQMANISDSNTATWDASAAAGGANCVSVRWNGSAWSGSNSWL